MFGKDRKNETFKFKFNRKYGFSKNNWSKVKNEGSVKSYNFVKSYCDKIEKETTFRDITNNKIEIVLSILAVIILSLMLTVGDWFVGFVSLVTLLVIIYFLSYTRSAKLKSLKKIFDLKLIDADFNYFGVKIENLFGLYKPFVYFLIPAVRLNVALTITLYVFSY